MTAATSLLLFGATGDLSRRMLIPSLFGLHGFVLGPVIAAMFMAAWGLLAAARRPPQ